MMRRILDTVTMLDKGDLLAAAWVGGDRGESLSRGNVLIVLGVFALIWNIPPTPW